MSLPVVDITHRLEFAAAHRMHNPALTPEENRELFGPCNRVHGHNYAVEATLRGPVDPRSGMVTNLVDLMRVMREEIFEPCDHRTLSEDVPFLEGVVISSETLAVAFWERLAAREAELGAPLVRVKVFESATNFVEYRGPSA